MFKDAVPYVEHFFSVPDLLIYLLLAFAVLLAAYFIVLIYVRAISHSYSGSKKKQFICTKFYSLTERLYEIVFSGTSILLFMTVYYLIERFFTSEPYITIWHKYRDFWLLLLIILSCLINSLLDSVLIRLKHLSGNDKATGRISGMIYMFLIFAYIKFIYGNDNYDVFITYFLGLMIGRFVYFDASFKDFLNSVSSALRNLPLVILGLAYTGAMCLYGFNSGYLIKHIGVVTDTCITHIFMCVAIAVLYHLPLTAMLTHTGRHNKSTEENDEYTDDNDEYTSDDTPDA